MCLVRPVSFCCENKDRKKDGWPPTRTLFRIEVIWPLHLSASDYELDVAISFLAFMNASSGALIVSGGPMIELQKEINAIILKKKIMSYSVV